LLKYIEVTGKNEEEAISKALAQLGLDRDDVSVELLERAKTGFLGIGSVPAKIKVTYEVPDEEIEEEELPEKEEELEEDVFEEAEEADDEDKEEYEDEEDEEEELEGDDQIAAAITRFMTGLFQHMDVEAKPVITKTESAYEVVLQGENLGSLIGRRGETLDAIQQLTGYAINHGKSKRVRIHVDAENYRARREESLQRLANKVAGKVVKYRKNITLEAMNAYERHVIHTALQDYPRITTYSVGTEPNRRTVVSYDPSKK